MEENKELEELKQRIKELTPEGYRIDVKISKNMTPHRRYLKMKRKINMECGEQLDDLLTSGMDTDYTARTLLDECSNWFIKECFEIGNITELLENEVDKAIELHEEYVKFILRKRRETLEWKKMKKIKN